MKVEKVCRMTPETWDLLELTPDEELSLREYDERHAPKLLTEEEARKAKNKAKRDRKKRR